MQIQLDKFYPPQQSCRELLKHLIIHDRTTLPNGKIVILAGLKIFFTTFSN